MSVTAWLNLRLMHRKGLPSGRSFLMGRKQIHASAAVSKTENRRVLKEPGGLCLIYLPRWLFRTSLGLK